MDYLYLGIAILAGVILGIVVTYLLINYLRQAQRNEYIRQAMELNLKKEMILKKDQQLERLQQQLFQMNGDLQRLEAEKQLAMEERSRQETFLAKWEEELRFQFEYLAQNILEKKSSLLTDVHRSQLEQVLNPMKDQLDRFQQRIQDTYNHESRERIQLQKEIEILVSLNQQLSEDAQNLTEALKGDNKVQGNWGEMILIRILEISGLRKDIEYRQQVSLSAENGKRLQPDVVIYLPGNKHLVIDAKVSLKAYTEMLCTELQAQKNGLLDQHIDSITRHIKTLAGKHYHLSEQLDCPEFVFMFLPVEPAFILALRHKPDLFTFAWDRKIILVSPSSLLATLKTVSSVWQIHYQNQNALEIARTGGILYDQFAGFVEELDQVEKHLDRAVRSHQKALSKMRDGHGNLIQQAEKLKNLGVKTQKSMKP